MQNWAKVVARQHAHAPKHPANLLSMCRLRHIYGTTHHCEVTPFPSLSLRSTDLHAWPTIIAPNPTATRNPP